MRIREMKDNDLTFALGVTSAEGWTTTRQDFEEILGHDPEGSFVGEMNGKTIGMVCTVPYDKFGFIGNLIVQPEFRRQGHGEELMLHAMDYLAGLGIRTQMLDGVDRAISLYERLGFKKKLRSLRLEGLFTGERVEGVRLISGQDLESLTAYDAYCFGSSRRVFLEHRLKKFPDFCMLAEAEDRILGYIMGSQCGELIRVGPWVVSRGTEAAEKLLSSFSEAAEGRVLRIGVLENNDLAVSLLKMKGFNEVSFSWRMSTNPEETGSCSTHLFAICSPDRG